MDFLLHPPFSCDNLIASKQSEFYTKLYNTSSQIEWLYGKGLRTPFKGSAQAFFGNMVYYIQFHTCNM